MQAKFVAARLIELSKRVINFDKSLQVYQNGIGNEYPERVERVINNSVTAKRATRLFRKYIVGRGFASDDINNFIVNKTKGMSLYRFLYKVANSYTRQNGAFVHINYNLNYEITSLDVLPYTHCLLGKEDSNKYKGKILVYDNWLRDANPKFDKDKIAIIDVFNPDKKVLEAQIARAGGISKYKGQIFFFNPEETIYPLSHIDEVLNDADSEFRASQFKNISLRKGFFGKQIAITPPMVDGDLKARSISKELTDLEIAEFTAQEKERENFKEALQSFVGVENVDGMLHLEMEFEGDDIDKIMKFIEIKTNINDKLFAFTEESVSKNIGKALEVPNILIDNHDNSIFGNSGEMITQAKQFYQEQREEDIKLLEVEVINPLMRIFKGFQYPENGLQIVPLINVQKTETNVNN